MLCCPLLRVSLLALCIAPAVAQGTAAYRPQLRSFLPVNSESSFLQGVPPDTTSALPSAGVPDAGSTVAAGAAFVHTVAPPRRLSLNTFFFSKDDEHLLANIGQRETQEGGDTGQQAHPLLSPAEAVSSPGTQLHTYLPEGQRPPVHVGHENAESLRPDAPISSDNEAAGRVAAPWRRSNKEAHTPHSSGPTRFMDTATRAAKQTQADGTGRGAVRLLAAVARNGRGRARPAAVAVSTVSGPLAATATPPVPRQLQAQKVLVISDSPGPKIRLGRDSSTSQLPDGISAAPASTSRAFNSEGSNPEPQAGKTRNSTGASSTSNKTVNEGHDIGTEAAVKEAHAAGDYLQGKRQETRAATAAAPSSILQSPLFPEEEEHDRKKAAANLVVKSAPSSMNPQHHRLLAAGIYGASANALRALDTKNSAGGRETGAADLISGARGALSTLPSLTAAADSSTGLLFFGGKSSSATAGEQQAPNARIREAASSLLNGSKQGADTVKDTISEENNAVKRVPETAQEEIIKRDNPLSNVHWFFTTSKEGQTARKSLDTSSFASRFLSHLLAQETEKTASHSLDRAATPPQTRSWWLSGDTSHASATQQQQQQHLSSGSSSAWWGNPGASRGGSNDVVDRAQKLYEKARESAEGKSENPSSSLSNLLWFFKSSKEEKKEAAAKAAVKAALSWIADCQQQIQAAVKTLLPASTPQGTATAAVPATIDNTSATALTLKHSVDALQGNEPALSQLEHLLKKLSARQQELSELTDSEAKSWYSSTQQRVMEQGPTAALASWLYAGSSCDSSTTSSASQSYFPRAQHVGTPVVSLPFFSTGLWGSSKDRGSQNQQQLEAQPAQVKSTSPTLPWWLHKIFTRKAVGDGDVRVHAAPEAQQQSAATQASISSWIEWIVGNRQTRSDTQASNLIRKAATAPSPGSEGTSWGETGAALLPLADVAGWLPSGSTSRSPETAMNTSRLGLFGSKPLATEKGAVSDPERASTGLAGAVGGGFVSKVAASLQSAFLGTPEREEAAPAKEEPIRAPGLPRGAYWWEWQRYPDSETTGGTKAPIYMRHIHLDCDPVLPFQSCVHDCQKESARSLLSSISREKKTEEAEESGSATDSKGARVAEPPALDSYEYSTLRSCYLKCKERWLDTDLPGCLRADGVKVEGVPPAAAYRSTSTTTTTVPTTASYPAAAAEAPAPLTDESEGFWSRIRGKKQEQPPSDTTVSEESEGKSSFSVFHLRASAEKTPPPATEVEQEKRSLKNLFGLLQKRATVPQTPAPTFRESIAKLPQTLWNHLKSGEANAADASGTAGSASSASTNWGADSSHLSSATEGVTAEHTNSASGTTSWWNLLFNGSKKGNREPEQVAPIAMEQRIHAARTTEQPEAADNAGESKLTFSHWCILLVVCMCGALVSIFLVSLRRRDILTRLWGVFHSDTNAPAAASLLTWHSLYEQISPKNEQCKQQLSFCSADGGTHVFEKSDGPTQPLIRDKRPSL